MSVGSPMADKKDFFWRGDHVKVNEMWDDYKMDGWTDDLWKMPGKGRMLAAQEAYF